MSPFSWALPHWRRRGRRCAPCCRSSGGPGHTPSRHTPTQAQAGWNREHSSSYLGTHPFPPHPHPGPGRLKQGTQISSYLGIEVVTPRRWVSYLPSKIREEEGVVSREGWGGGWGAGLEPAPHHRVGRPQAVQQQAGGAAGGRADRHVRLHQRLHREDSYEKVYESGFPEV